MGLQDRDYMRRRQREPRAVLTARVAPDRADRTSDWRTRLLVVGCVVAVAGVALWLLRGGAPRVQLSTPAQESRLVNINSATQAQLETVPGIGPALAGRIIAGRPYRSVDELVRISGIGERTLASMRPFMTTGGETPP
jgi:DNA uptake protein ComE-like DNA-binding protein